MTFTTELLIVILVSVAMFAIIFNPVAFAFFLTGLLFGSIAYMVYAYAVEAAIAYREARGK